jgi:hypothetical protein
LKANIKLRDYYIKTTKTFLIRKKRGHS